MNDVDLAIVGGGAAGTMVLAHLARTSTRPMRVAFIDAGPGRFGAGTAYRTEDSGHLLNVRATAMSAWQDQPDHFTQWLGTTGRLRANGSEFVARSAYGSYLSSVAYDAANSDLVDTRLIHGTVARMHRRPDGWTVAVDGVGPLSATQVVLAIGIEPPSQKWVPRRLRCMPRYIADPWRPGAFDAIDIDDQVLMVGSGLTAVDIAVTLSRRVRRPIVATSRHGVMPATHRLGLPRALPVDERSLPGTIAELRHLVHARIRESRAVHGDWRPAIDGLRPHTQRIWRALSDTDRVEFVRHDLRRWETLDTGWHRRLPPRFPRCSTTAGCPSPLNTR